MDNTLQQARAIIDDLAEIARQDRFGYDSTAFRAAAAERLAGILDGLRAPEPEAGSAWPGAATENTESAEIPEPLPVRRGPGRPRKNPI